MIVHFSHFPRVKIWFIPGLLLFPLLLILGCGKPQGEILRYRFQAGQKMDYLISLVGEGEVSIGVENTEGGKDTNTFPVEIKGDFNLGLEVLSVSSQGVAELSVSYSQFNISAADRHDGRDLRIVLSDDAIETWEGSMLLNEVISDDEEFFLKDLLGKKFKLVMDSRGKVLELDDPATLSQALPYIRIRQLLLASQPEFPDEPILKGDVWERQLSLTLPQMVDRFSPGESFEGVTKYTLMDKQDRNHPSWITISLEGDLDKEKDETDEQSQLLGFSQKFKGELTFDQEKGRLLSSALELKQDMMVLIVIPRLSETQGLEMGVNMNLTYIMKPREKR